MRLRLSLPLLVAALGAGAAMPLVAPEMLPARHAPVRAAVLAAVPRPSPGQLTITDKNNKTIGICPLEHTDVSADVAGVVARVTVRQEFANPSREPIEAVYTFPLPSDAAVDGMTLRIGARTIKGEIKRREEARQIYQAARARGQAAALLDQERPNIFTQAVANILPGEKVSVVISYVHLLKYEEGRYEWTFPMVVGPRFVSAGGGDTMPDANKITPPITAPGTRAGHDISLSVNLDAGTPLGPATSPLHAIDVRRRGASAATIRLKNQNEIPNKDFVLRFAAASNAVQSGLLSHAPPGEQGAGGGCKISVK